MKRLIPVALFAVIAVASTACATGYAYGNRGGYSDRGYYANVERRAYDNGFRDGLRAGVRDGRDRGRYEPTHHNDWRHADNGYRREYGDRGSYRRNFRAGFEAGYSQAFRRSDNGRYRR